MDTISNLITAIRNAEMASHTSLEVPTSKMSLAILAILKNNGYIASFEQNEAKISIVLTKKAANRSYRRISKPGRRLYTDHKKIPTVLGGRGMVILSTSAGVMSGKDAKKQKVGGEILCEVY